MTKKETKQIRRLFEKLYIKINSKYTLQKPELKIVHYPSSTAGRAVASKNLVVINSTGEHYKKTIIHEILHIVNQLFFNPLSKKKLGHNKQFWLLCYEFGLTEKDYGYGLTNNMRKAKIEFKKLKNKNSN